MTAMRMQTRAGTGLRSALFAWLVAGAAVAQADSSESTLWRTPDQRGDAALRAGDAAAAARTYADPRRKAYAELKAGHHLAAAEGYAALDDPESAYNLGNALARAGDLRGALQAYDAALVRDPGDRDAQRNRDLVAQAMGAPQQAGAQQGQNASPFAGGAGAQRTAQAASGPSGQAPAQPGSRDRNGPPTPAAGSRSESRTAGSTTPSARSDDDAEQAQRDARQARDSAQAPGRPPETRGDRNAAPPPRTERQLAEDQWLRRLPDDPSGLLRRKFLIQYQMRLGTSP